MIADKRKLVFMVMILIITAFIGIYGYMIMDDDDSEPAALDQPQVPLLQEKGPEYNTRKEAVDNVRELRPSIAPSMYDEKMIDPDGRYDPYLEEKQKMKLMDSVLAAGADLQEFPFNPDFDPMEINRDTVVLLKDTAVSQPTAFELSDTRNKAFFHGKEEEALRHPVIRVRAVVSGDQVIRSKDRLELRLADELVYAGDTIPKNTVVYASCDLQSNRLLLTIYPNENFGFKMKAFDRSDGQEGLYIENSLRSEATSEVIADAIDDINISGIPQVRGLKNIFQRNQRNIKVKVLHQYELILKPIL